MDGRDSLDPLDSLNKIDGLWYDDADVVFCAGKSKFRVYRGILSAQSKEFRDMLAKSQGSVTVINLPDKERDVQRFFKAIFDPSFYIQPSKGDLDVTVSILRLALKYGVPFLIQRAVSHLDSLFPLERKEIVAQNIPKDDLELCIDIIPLASIADAKWIVPSVLYSMNLMYLTTYIISRPSFALLPDGYYQTLIVASCVNNELYESHCNSWVGMLPSELCANPEGCAYVSKAVQARDHKTRVGFGPSRWSPDEKLSNGKRFCGHCQAAGMKYRDELEEKYWNRYPVLCDFESWERVKWVRHKAVVLGWERS